MTRSRTTSQTEHTLDPSAALSGARRPDRLLAIYSIGRQLLEQRDPGEVIRTIHQALIDHLHPDHSCVLSVSRTGELKALASRNLDLTGPESEWELSHTACDKARETGLAVLMADQIDDLAVRAADSVDILKIRSIICVPLAQNPVKGLIYLDNRGRTQAVRSCRPRVRHGTLALHGHPDSTNAGVRQEQQCPQIEQRTAQPARGRDPPRPHRRTRSKASFRVRSSVQIGGRGCERDLARRHGDWQGALRALMRIIATDAASPMSRFQSRLWHRR